MALNSPIHSHLCPQFNQSDAGSVHKLHGRRYGNRITAVLHWIHTVNCACKSYEVSFYFMLSWEVCISSISQWKSGRVEESHLENTGLNMLKSGSSNISLINIFHSIAKKTLEKIGCSQIATLIKIFPSLTHEPSHLKPIAKRSQRKPKEAKRS